MWRLSKEVFKSLSKNKIMVIGLSILIFITSAVFTLLSSLRSSIVSGFENYKKLSVKHDLSVDLNLPSQGSAYNQGYFVNGEVLGQNGVKEYKPINYYLANGTGEYRDSVENVLYLQNTEFIKLSNFTGIDGIESNSNYYLRRDDLDILYSIYSSNKNNPIVEFKLGNDENDANQASFKLKQAYRTFNIYEKKGNKFEIVRDTKSLNSSDKVTFVKDDLKLSDLMILKKGTDSSKPNIVYAEQVQPLFINVLDKKITNEYSVGNSWVAENKGIVIPANEWIEKFGFKKLGDNNFVFINEGNNKETLSKFLDAVKLNNSDLLDEKSKVKSEWTISDFYNKSTIEAKPAKTIAIKKDTEIIINKNLLAKKSRNVSFERWNYHTTYVGDKKNQWTGAFKTFVDELEKSKDDHNSVNYRKWKNLKEFSNWTKNIKTVFEPYDSSNFPKKEVNISTLINELDAKQKLYNSDDTNNNISESRSNFPGGSTYKIGKSGAKNIAEIETFIDRKDPNYERKLLDAINDKDLKNKNFNFIKQEAYEVTKNIIIDKIAKEVGGRKNIGLRKTITVDAIDEKTKKQNVFHFINTGDENGEVDGIKLNVGKLFGEQKNKSALIPTNRFDESVYRQNQLPPYIASLLIQTIGKNLFPDPKYVEPIYEFAEVTDMNPVTKAIRKENSKIVLLNKYLVNENNRSIDQNTLESEYKKLNLGITFRGNRYKLVTLVNSNNQLFWKTVYSEGIDQLGFDKGLLTKWMEQNKVTLATKFIKTDDEGWVKKDQTLANISYVPTQFLSPKAELINDILATGKVDFLSEAIEKELLDSALVKEEFISQENVFLITNALKKVLNNNNFASAFTSSKINRELLPKIGLDLLYELSHSDSGNIFKSVLFNIFEKVKAKISEKGTLENQKKYVIDEVNNIYSLINGLAGIDISKYLSAEDIVNFSEDPKKVIDAFQNIITSIDAYKFSQYANDWYKNEWRKQVDHNKNKYTNRLSSGLLINWLFKSVDQKTLKTGLKKLIDNLDFEKIVSLDDKNSFLYKKLNSSVPSLIDGINVLLKKISKDGKFDNIKEGINKILQNIDFNVLSKYLDDHLETNYFEYKKSTFDYELNKEKVLKEKVALKTIRPKDGMMALIYGLFSNPGTNREFKDNLIKMFNLSSKVSESKVKNGTGTIINPDSDPDKLSFSDFLAFFPALLSADQSKAIFKNQQIFNEIDKAKQHIISILLHKKNSANIFDLDIKVVETLKKFNVISNETIINQQVIDKLTNIENFLKQTTTSINEKIKVVDEKNKTLADLIYDFNNFSDGDTNWQTWKSLIGAYGQASITNKFSLGAQAFDLLLPWINMLAFNKEANQKEALNFIRDFLKLSIDPDILRDINKLAEDENLPSSADNKFGLSIALHRPEQVTLFNQNNDKFTNAKVEKLASENPKFRKYLISQKRSLIELLGLIGASQQYSKYETKPIEEDKIYAPNGIYYETIKKSVDKYFSTKEFWDIRDIALSITRSMQINFPIELFGLSRIIINPVLRSMYPQLMTSFLSTQKKNLGSINGNLAYIVLSRIGNFEEIIRDESKKSELEAYFEQIWSNNDTSLVPLDYNEEITLSLDGARINKLFNENNKKTTVFGINFMSLAGKVINGIVEPKELKDIVFNDINSYYAKVNYAYLAKNNKAIYNGTLPKNNVEMESLINTIDDKYILDVNGIKFLIVGEDTTIDYIYPVIDENHLQVNTQNQALVYLNNYGFSRVVAAYQGNVIKKNLLVVNGSKNSNEVAKRNIINIVDSSISDANKLKRVFLYNELDPINPERALRITTIERMIGVISSSIIALMTLFIIMVSVAIIFIIRRYIANKAKVFGILLAQGYKPIEIAISLLSFAAVTSLIGGILGYSIGFRTQILLQNVFSNYWTLPKSAIPFDFFALFFNVFIPFIGMSLLIIVVALISLRKSSIDLITGVDEAPKGKLFTFMKKKFINKKNVKKRFRFTLAYSGFWKLASFGGSVLLTSIATMFGLANFKSFNKTINDTYKNRDYKFKVDLESPTVEGGDYSLYNPKELNNLIYTPIGSLNEGNRETADYFKPGKSSIINPNNNDNGMPSDKSPHILSQFSVNVTVDAGVSADPWLIAYNGMPDSQKAKIDKIRDLVGHQLEWTQSLDDNGELIADPNKPIIKVDSNGLMSYEDGSGKKYDFFKYYKSPNDKQGSFRLAHWDEVNKEYVMKIIKTGSSGGRNEYRDFLVRAYKKNDVIRKQHERMIASGKSITNPIRNWTKSNNSSDFWLIDKSDLNRQWVNDYFIGFGGILFDKSYDETYTYLSGTYNNVSAKIYGYRKPVDFKNAKVKLIDKAGNNLYEVLDKYEVNNNVYPLVVNDVFAKKHKLGINDLIDFKVGNRVDRYKQKIIEKIYANDPVKQADLKNEYNKKTNAKFQIVGINPTYINDELITTHKAANLLIGMTDIDNGFNGVLTQNANPVQVTESAGLYSVSGYWAGLDGFDVSSLDNGTVEKMFVEIFGSPEKKGVLETQHGLTKNEIAKFLDSSANEFSKSLYESAKSSAKLHIDEFSKIYNNKLYIALSSSIDSKDIEVGFVLQVGSTIEQISIFIIVINFVISLIILIIMSSIIVSENERNIAIWSILGYSQKEKLMMFFGAFIPFLISAIVISIPIVIALISVFSGFLLSSSSIALLLSLKWWHVLITSGLMLTIFAITSISVWITINKMKPVDLLKGK